MGRWVQQAGSLLVRKHGAIIWACLYCTDAHAGWIRSRTTHSGRGLLGMHQVITIAHYLDL